MSKIRVANRLYKIEYESLPSNCFSCGMFGHLKEVCPHELSRDGVDGSKKGMFLLRMLS